jgi:Ca2+-transporting ATPase
VVDSPNNGLPKNPGVEFSWHGADVGAVARQLDTDPVAGLSNAQASSRLAEFGPNSLRAKKKKTPLVLFLEQFKDFMIVVLIASAIVAGVIGEMADTIAIVVIVALNAMIGFVQEYRAEKAMAALKKWRPHPPPPFETGPPRPSRPTRSCRAMLFSWKPATSSPPTRDSSNRHG